MDDLIRRVDALASIKALYPNMMPIIDIFDARRKWFEKNKPYFECENVIEQLPSVKQEPCEDTISRQNDILPNIDKKVESYKKVIKNPVVKSIMGMDEEQEQIDFVQPHKKIPVTLTVQKEKTCDGCLFQQYPRITICQECSRYYSDNYVKE